jgi:predicted enzyme related to lactoylglutathione lyase
MKPQLNYVEFPSKDLALTQDFFETVFGWVFTSYGEDYIAFSAKSAGLEGGFYKSELKSEQQKGSALMVFLSENLEKIQNEIIAAGGVINVAIFQFPGGKRFHFIEPSGNEFAVWSMD